MILPTYASDSCIWIIMYDNKYENITWMSQIVNESNNN